MENIEKNCAIFAVSVKQRKYQVQTKVKKIVKLQKKVLRNLQRENYRILSNYSKKKFVIFEK